jgi:hypothetical protein
MLSDVSFPKEKVKVVTHFLVMNGIYISNSVEIIYRLNLINLICFSSD